MIKTSPYPGEFISGHLGRMRVLNGLKNNDVTLSKLKQYLGTKNRCHALARISKLNRAEYIQKHTLVPLLHLYNPRGLKSHQAEEFGSKIDYYWAREPSSITTVRLAKCCRYCIQRQLNNLGFSYWIREHQIPGLVLCPVHKEPLITINMKNAFENAPHYYLEANSHELEFELPYSNWGAVSRYSTVAASLLSLKKPLRMNTLPIQNAQNNFFNGFSYLHLRKVFFKRRQIILKHYPQSWIYRHFYENSHIFEQKHRKRINGNILERLTHYVLTDLLAISAVFDTSKIALAYLYSEL